MRKKNVRGVISIVLSFVLMLSLFVGLGIDSYADEETSELPTGLKEPVIEYEEVSPEEFDKLLEEARIEEEKSNAESGFYKATDGFWSQFSQPYYNYSFSKLNSNQQSFYYTLYNKFYSMIDGGSDCTKTTTDGNGKLCYLTPVAEFTGLSAEEAQNVGLLLMYDRPELYYINEVVKVYYEPGNNRWCISFGVYDGLQTGAARATAASQMKSKINWYLNQVSTGDSAYTKEKKIHDLLIDNCYYGNSNTRYNQSCASVFLNTGGETVCAGYSEAFALLCYARGIQAVSVTSKGHEWNMANIDGYWYSVDATFDDTSGSRYKFFNKSESTMTSLDSVNHSIESLWSSVGRPSCPYDWGNAPSQSGTTWYNGRDYSGVYNFNDYINNYADLKAAFGSNPSGAIEHFVNCGMNEGRQAKSTFDVVSYRNQWSDLRRAFGWNNLRAYYEHYLNCGFWEGRAATGCSTVLNPLQDFFGYDCSAIYNYQYYIENNPDIRNAFNGDDTATFIHFLTCGMNEGRRACTNFDVYSYRNQWSDLRQAFGWNNLSAYYSHYLNCGRFEGRAATGCDTLQNPICTFFGVDFSSVYDYNYYNAVYADLRNAFGGDDGALFVHFLTSGMDEGRRAKSTFDVHKYISNYEDLRRAFGWNIRDYYLHYVSHGVYEGRIAS